MLKKIMIITSLYMVIMAYGTHDASANSLLSVKDIYAQASAATSQEAKNKAIDKALRQAVKVVLERLSYPKTVEDFFREQRIDTPLQLVKKLTFEHEVAAKGHFSASFSVIFTSMPFEKIQAQQSVFINNISERTLIIPYFSYNDEVSLWGEKNLWYNAWQDMLSGRHVPGVLLPMGDVSDIRVLHEADIRDNPAKVNVLLEKYGAKKVIISKAAIANGELLVEFKNVDGNENDHEEPLRYAVARRTLSDNAALLSLLTMAAGDVYDNMLIEKEFKRIYTDNLYDITAAFHPTDFTEYLRFRKLMDSVKFEKKPQLIELTAQKVMWRLYFKKEIATFISFLYKNGIVLRDVSGNWQLESVAE